jgi:hypothetical protein
MLEQRLPGAALFWNGTLGVIDAMDQAGHFIAEINSGHSDQAWAGLGIFVSNTMEKLTDQPFGPLNMVLAEVNHGNLGNINQYDPASAQQGQHFAVTVELAMTVYSIAAAGGGGGVPSGGARPPVRGPVRIPAGVQGPAQAAVRNPPAARPPRIPAWQPNPGRCFPAGTLVATAQSLKEIETILPGEAVWAYDLAEMKWKFCQVAETFEHEFHGDLITVEVAGESIEATWNHPFWVIEGRELARRGTPEDVPEMGASATIGRWVEARDIRPGDVLLLRGRKRAEVSGLATRLAHETVYNLHVLGLNNYAVGAAQTLVHNKRFGRPGRPGAINPNGGHRPGQRPTNAPSGTRPINRHPDTRNIVHRIKRNLREEGVGPASYVGISPEGNVIVTNPDGTAANLGHWSQYAD